MLKVLEPEQGQEEEVARATCRVQDAEFLQPVEEALIQLQGGVAGLGGAGGGPGRLTLSQVAVDLRLDRRPFRPEGSRTTALIRRRWWGDRCTAPPTGLPGSSRCLLISIALFPDLFGGHYRVPVAIGETDRRSGSRRPGPLWRVAAADHGFCTYQEHLVPKVSGPFHVPHPVFIAAMRRAQDINPEAR